MRAEQILCLVSLCAAICTLPRFQTVKWRPFRTGMFVSLGLSGVLPMSHAARRFGVYQASLQMGWAWFVAEAVFYIIGAIVYAVGTWSLIIRKVNWMDRY